MDVILKKNKNFYTLSKDTQANILINYIEESADKYFYNENIKILYNILAMTLSSGITLYTLNKFF
jgi:uncharacterized protein (DUF2164 family)